MTKPEVPKSASNYLSEIGRKGGLASGESKKRGDPEYYSKLRRGLIKSKKAKKKAK
jgi:general stress protein YciG